MSWEFDDTCREDEKTPTLPREPFGYYEPGLQNVIQVPATPLRTPPPPVPVNRGNISPIPDLPYVPLPPGTPFTYDA